MLKRLLRLLTLEQLVQATQNLLAGIRPTITSPQPKFLGSNKPSPGCNDSGGNTDSDLAQQTWAFSMESPADINTVSIFFKDKPERPPSFEVRVGFSSNADQNQVCAGLDRLPTSDTNRAWLRCGLKGNFMSVTFCGEDNDNAVEIKAYSLHAFGLRKIVSTSSKPSEDHESTTWVSQSGLPMAPENVVAGNVLQFSSAILISYVKMAGTSQKAAISVADGQKNEYHCEPIESDDSYQEVICDLRGDGLTLDLTRLGLPKNMLLLTQSDPSTVSFEADGLKQPLKNQVRQLQGPYYCSNPTGKLNQLNTGVVVDQNSYAPSCGTTPVTPCDGFVLEINISTFAYDNTKVGCAGGPGLYGYWQATFAVSTTIKTVLFLNEDCSGCDSYIVYWIVTFGTDPDVAVNPVCIAQGAMTNGGWYSCPTSMTGTIFGVRSTTSYVNFREAMLYSQEAIQLNAAYAYAYATGILVPNALQNIVVLWWDSPKQKCIVANPPPPDSAGVLQIAKIVITLKAHGKINGVVMLPGYVLYSNTYWRLLQQNLAISANVFNIGNHLCGIIADYYLSYQEVTCNIVANQITIAQQTTGKDVLLCGVGIMSDCDCAQTQVNRDYFTDSRLIFSSPFITKSLGSTDPITITVRAFDTVSYMCGNGDGFSKCGARTIKLYQTGTNTEITSWPYNGLTWNQAVGASTGTLTLDGAYQVAGTFTIDVEIKLTSIVAVPLFRQTITVVIDTFYCANPTGKLNLLNTGVVVKQRSFYGPLYSKTPVTPCDGVVLPINTATFAWDWTKFAVPYSASYTLASEYWRATFPAPTSIKTSLIIHNEYASSRPPTWTTTFGTNPDVSLNPVCLAVGTITGGGWQKCPSSMTGTIFGIYSINEYFDFREVMLYSQEAIQMNALSAVATDADGIYPASNALQNLVVLLVTLDTQKCIRAAAPASGLAKIVFTLKAFGVIAGVVMLPGFQTIASNWSSFQNNVAISANVFGVGIQLCGNVGDYYTSTYGEVTCNIVANQIIIEQQTAGSDVLLCGVGIMSDCDCALTSFDPAAFTTAPVTTLVSANLIRRMIGNTIPITITVASAIFDTVSSMCGNGDGLSKCGATTIKFYDSSNTEIVSWPYNGVAWNAATGALTLDGAYQTVGLFTIDVEISLASYAAVPYRQTITVEVYNVYCANPTGMLNQLNTGVVVRQSSFFPSASQTPATPCDGFVLQINTATFAWDDTTLANPATAGPSEYWKATFPAPTSIRTSLIIARDDGFTTRPPTWTTTFGTNSDYTLNPICLAVGTITSGGWYMCPSSMTGTIFAIYSATEYFDFREVMLYSQEAIQMNALSAVATDADVIYPASNALQNIVVLWVDSATQKCIRARAPALGLATFLIELKAYGKINGVALLPAYKTSASTLPATQTNIAISGKTGSTTKLCGNMTNYYNQYSEVPCGFETNQIIIEQTTVGLDLYLCGVGVFSDCDCATSSFDPLKMTSPSSTPFASVTTLSVKSTDAVQTIKFNLEMPDTISSICGTADGVSYCGMRQIIFTDNATGSVIESWPYQGYNWNPLTSSLTLQPGSAKATSVLTATLSLINQPKVIYSQQITVNVASPAATTTSQLFMANQMLTAVIDQEAILQLPDQTANSTYALISTHAFSVTLDGKKLTVKSSNVNDVGNHQIAMSLTVGNQTAKFQVNVVFQEIPAAQTQNTTEIEGNNQSSTAVVFVPKAQTKKKEEQKPVIPLPLVRPQIKFISNMALVNVTFHGNISQNISKSQIQVRYTQNSNEIDQTQTFKWNITEVNTTWSEHFMLIQLNFTHPILVSQGNKPDMLEVLYRNDYLYPLGKIAPFNDTNFTSTTTIMAMLAPSEKMAIVINTISSLAGLATQSSFWAFLAAYLVLSTIMKYVWMTFNTLQIILIMPMLMVKMPVNVTDVQNSFKKIVNLEFIDKKQVWKTICEPLFGEIIESVKNPDGDSSGELLAERSKSLVLQIVLLAVFVVIIVALMVSLLLIRICARKIKNQKILNVYKSIEAKVMFSSVLRYGIQQYLQLALTTMITFHDWAVELAPGGQRLLQSADVVPPDAAKPDVKKIVITSLLSVFLVLFPPFCVWFLRRYQIILYLEGFKMRYGTLYVGLNYYKPESLVYLTIFLVRRALLAVIVVFVTFNAQLQLLLTMYLSMIMLYYLIVYMPMWDTAHNVIYIFNEGCLFVCSAMMFLFTDYVPTPEDRFSLGWVYLGLLCFNVLGNGAYVVYDIVVQIKQKMFYKKEKERKLWVREWYKEAEIRHAKQAKEAELQQAALKAQKDAAEDEEESEYSYEASSESEEEKEPGSGRKVAADKNKREDEHSAQVKGKETTAVQQKNAEEQKIQNNAPTFAGKEQPLVTADENYLAWLRAELNRRKQAAEVSFEQQMADIENEAEQNTKLEAQKRKEEHGQPHKTKFNPDISREYEEILAQDERPKAKIEAPKAPRSRPLIVNDYTTGAAQSDSDDEKHYGQMVRDSNVKSTKPQQRPPMQYFPQQRKETKEQPRREQFMGTRDTKKSQVQAETRPSLDELIGRVKMEIARYSATEQVERKKELPKQRETSVEMVARINREHHRELVRQKEAAKKESMRKEMEMQMELERKYGRRF